MSVVHSQNSEREISQLFMAPHVSVQLLGACQGAVFSPQTLEKIILQDSTFCVKVLNAAVQSCSGRIDPAAPLTSALNTLSLPVLKSLAIQSAKRLVETNFTAAQAQFMRELWFYSQVGGISARCLAESISYPAPEEAQLTGLLQNVGMLALFSRNPDNYIRDIGTSFSGKEVRGQEQVRFGIDHFQVADGLISGWQLESFMADAVNFQHLDIEQCKDASTLIRIARLSREICKSPFELNDDTLSAAQILFNFTKSDTEYLVGLAEKQYRSLTPFDGDQNACLEEVGRVQKRLTSVVFSIADQEGIRSQLADSTSLEDFVGTARHLYLHSTAATEAIFFVTDPQNARLVGLPSPEQVRLVNELSTSLNKGSLLAEALQSEKLSHSFDREMADISLFDQQLIRLCKGQGIVCLPLQMEDQKLGGVALGLGSKSDLEIFSSPSIQVLGSSVAKALAGLTKVQQEPPEIEPGRSDVNLIPKLVHEVSNPLTIINNYISVVGTLLQGTESEEILPAIENEIKRIGDILKYYTDLKETPQMPDPAVALNDLILSVVESLRPAFFKPKKIEILTDFDSTILPVKTRSVVIKQILVNLLKNAAEALDNGGKISLTTREHVASDGQHYVDISVQDNGPGIDRKIQDRLFSPVTSTKGGDHAGLGLNIVKGMVDNIGAKISCHSSAEFGTSFNLVIPRIDE
ncbi:MAG TPA: HDOD domain-containing protein [Geopsychrobacteraceae bacterium]|nr:HDOD domain-containing protein [Geopsychrobacteraceae bacterium]